MSNRVLITGGASGFGEALAKIYAGRGDKVLVTDVHPVLTDEQLPGATAEGEVAYLQLDVRDEDGWEKACGWVVERWGGLDLLINNAGVAAGGRIDVTPIEDWQWIIDINLLGVVKGCRAVVPLMKERRSGRIANVASMAGLVHPPAMAPYNVVKAGVVALSETLLHELAAYGVDVSVICPSFFKTNLDQSLRGSDPAMEESAAGLITTARCDADTIAERTVEALDEGHYLILPHAEGQLAYRGKRLTPKVYHRTMKVAGEQLAKKGAERDAARKAAEKNG